MTLPQFLNPTAGLVAAAIAVPLLLLLYFLKLRRAPAPVSSTLLWKRSVEDLQVNAPFQWLRRNLLLLLQLLVLAALLLALARPVGDGAGVAGERSILLIDRSASMNARDVDGGGTRLDEAKRRAKAVVDTMGRGDRAMVVAFSDEGGTRPAQPFTSDTSLLKAAIDAVEPSDRPTRPAAAYELANASSSFMDERLRADELTAATVFLFSDGRVAEGDAGGLSVRGEIRYDKIGSLAASNLAVVAASVKRNYERPAEAQVFARAANFGDAVATANVRISVASLGDDGELGAFEPVSAGPVRVTLPPARWTDAAWREAATEADPAAVARADEQLAANPRRDSVDVRLTLPGAAAVRVELVDDNGNAIADDLSADDVAHVVVPPPEPLRVLLVTRGNYWLNLLLETQRLDEPRTVSPAEYEAMLSAGEAGDFDVTIFDGYAPPSLPEAGTFAFSGTLPPEDATAIRPLTSDDGVPLYYEASGVLDWDRDHPMLRGLNLNRLWAAEGRLVAVPLGAELLVEGVGGPMVLLERRGRRTNLVFTFDLAQSTWPRQRTFPIFAYLMFEYLAQSGDVRARESVRPGEVVAVPPTALERASVGEGGLELVSPAGDRITIPVDAAGGATLAPLDRVGLYATDPPVPGFERVAVSLLDANESNTLPSATDPGNLGQRDADAAVVAGLAEAGDGEEDSSRLVELWWWLVAAGVGLLMVEWFVYARRVGG